MIRKYTIKINNYCIKKTHIVCTSLCFTKQLQFGWNDGVQAIEASDDACIRVYDIHDYMTCLIYKYKML